METLTLTRPRARHGDYHARHRMLEPTGPMATRMQIAAVVCVIVLCLFALNAR